MSAPKYSVDEARRLAQILKAGNDRIAPELRRQARVAAKKIDILARAKQQFENGTRFGNIAMTITKSGYTGISINGDTTRDGLQQMVETMLASEVDNAKTSEFFRVLQRVNSTPARAVSESSAGHFTEKASSGISGIFERHQNWVASKSSGGRLAISVAEVGLGLVGMNAGIRMVQEATHGIQGKKIVETGQSGDANIAFALVPMGTGKRAFKALAGTAITAASISALLLGTINFGRSHEM